MVGSRSDTVTSLFAGHSLGGESGGELREVKFLDRGQLVDNILHLVGLDITGKSYRG